MNFATRVYPLIRRHHSVRNGFFISFVLPVIAATVSLYHAYQSPHVVLSKSLRKP